MPLSTQNGEARTGVQVSPPCQGAGNPLRVFHISMLGTHGGNPVLGGAQRPDRGRPEQPGLGDARLSGVKERVMVVALKNATLLPWALCPPLPSPLAHITRLSPSSLTSVLLKMGARPLATSYR